MKIRVIMEMTPTNVFTTFDRHAMVQELFTVISRMKQDNLNDQMNIVSKPNEQRTVCDDAALAAYRIELATIDELLLTFKVEVVM